MLWLSNDFARELSAHPAATGFLRPTSPPHLASSYNVRMTIELKGHSAVRFTDYIFLCSLIPAINHWAILECYLDLFQSCKSF